ncbi:MAG: DUF1566 domain-containing protein [Sulfurovum sp.]|nr:DUF1566 domain-containing protein [Sulfurovum sp.]
MTITIRNVAETVATLTALNITIDETLMVGTQIGLVTVSDEGDTSIISFELNDTSSFEVNANGEIRSTVALDYEITATYILEVRANNDAGYSQNVEINISINDVNISSAVYDDNATADSNDDSLQIYFDRDINATLISADNGSFVFSGGETIVVQSEDYNSSWFRYEVLFESASEILKDTNISINAGVEIAREIESINKFSRINTGQTTSYADYDDANLSRGRTQAYTDNGDGTITDINTGLIWQQEDDNNTYTHANAILYCEGLDLGNDSTHWRLPSIDELVSIIDNGRANPAINPLFTNTNTSFYWSVTL